MVLELLAIWAIVIVTVIWFVRDERRLAADADLARAAAYYAHASRYRHAVAQSDPVPQPRPRQSGLTADQRAFFLKALQR